jgi:hypothetical protein
LSGVRLPPPGLAGIEATLAVANYVDLYHELIDAFSPCPLIGAF